ncbi:hypothetical protein [Flexivirga caeni]|uniref:Uncharacterized protein n=1 Tax=Flexivirga caeni TaxID=2294115 RepID=A0A3M9M4J1_9MICO|nr:hypothetical protein [Flexivirga caeni]RNI20481.1 hypothetical protein EFY87_14725 [Flexivirga caeni]
MSFLKRSKPQLSDEVLAQLRLPKGERVLASAVDQLTGARVVATNWHLIQVAADGTVTPRPWHEVDAGQWNSEAWTLSVTWIETRRPSQWTFGEQDTRLPETFHERVRASIVLAEDLPLTGRAKGRVVVRRDLQTGQLLTQTVLGRATRADDPEVQDAVARTTAFVRDAVGL